MKTHTSRWQHDGGAVLARIEWTDDGYTWRAGHAYGVAESRQQAQRAVRKALREGIEMNPTGHEG